MRIGKLLTFLMAISSICWCQKYALLQIKADPDSSLFYQQIGSAKQTKRQYADALIDFQRAVHHDSTNFDAWLSKGICDYNLENYEAAIIACGILLSRDYNDISALKLRAESWRMAKHFENALKDYDHLIKIRAKDASIYFGRGYSLSKLGFHENAITDFTRAINLQPKEPYFRQARAYEYYDLDEYNEVVNDLDIYFKLGGSDPRVYGHRAFSLIQLGAHNLNYCDRAISDLDKYKKVAYQDVRVVKMYALAYGIKEDSINSRKFFQMAMDITPDDIQTKFEWAALELNLRNYTRALELLSDLEPKVKETSSEFPYRLGIAKAQLKDTTGALNAYSKALAIDSSAKEVYRARVKLLLPSSKDLNQCVSDLNRLIELDKSPNTLTVYYSCLSALEFRLNNSNALLNVNTAIEAQPLFSFNFLVRALIESRSSLTKAIASCNQALAVKKPLWQARLLKDYFIRLKSGRVTLSKKANLLLKNQHLPPTIYQFIYEGVDFPNSQDLILRSVIYPFLKEGVVNLP